MRSLLVFVVSLPLVACDPLYWSNLELSATSAATGETIDVEGGGNWTVRGNNRLEISMVFGPGLGEFDGTFAWTDHNADDVADPPVDGSVDSTTLLYDEGGRLKRVSFAGTITCGEPGAHQIQVWMSERDPVSRDSRLFGSASEYVPFTCTE